MWFASRWREHACPANMFCPCLLSNAQIHSSKQYIGGAKLPVKQPLQPLTVSQQLYSTAQQHSAVQHNTGAKCTSKRRSHLHAIACFPRLKLFQQLLLDWVCTPPPAGSVLQHCVMQAVYELLLLLHLLFQPAVQHCRQPVRVINRSDRALARQESGYVAAAWHMYDCSVPVISFLFLSCTCVPVGHT